jgi:aminomethyltransferase
MNEQGGIRDDCIITKDEDNAFFVVINAGCKDKDLEYFHYHKNLSNWNNKDISIIYSEDNSLISVQGPKA